MAYNSRARGTARPRRARWTSRCRRASPRRTCGRRAPPRLARFSTARRYEPDLKGLQREMDSLMALFTMVKLHTHMHSMVSKVNGKHVSYHF